MTVSQTLSVRGIPNHSVQQAYDSDYDTQIEIPSGAKEVEVFSRSKQCLFFSFSGLSSDWGRIKFRDKAITFMIPATTASGSPTHLYLRKDIQPNDSDMYLPELETYYETTVGLDKVLARGGDTPLSVGVSFR